MHESGPPPKQTGFPKPEQLRVMWMALTALSWALIACLLLALGWLLVELLGLIYPVLFPLGVAAIVAFILDPAIMWFERRGFSRPLSMIWVLLSLIAVLAVVTLLIVVPLIEQTVSLINTLPENLRVYGEQFQAWANEWIQDHPEAKDWFDENLDMIISEAPQQLSGLSQYVVAPVAQIFNWFGLVIGFLFVPIYVFYFLIEKEGIVKNWRDYLPLTKSWVRDELAVVISEINYYLVVFFRGQVLVGAVIGVLTMIGLSAIGLPYGILIGFLAGALSLVPYLGVIGTLLPALIIGYTSGSLFFPDLPGWGMALLVAGVFSAVQTIEGFFVTPKIMGDRTGLHPLTVIISILIWTILLPGLLGPILAVPLTATLRVLMYRYVWLSALPDDIAAKKLEERERELEGEGSAQDAAAR
ncbi:MAG: AI-2E family transporter [Verrucomicrobiota bacterium]